MFLRSSCFDFRSGQPKWSSPAHMCPSSSQRPYALATRSGVSHLLGYENHSRAAKSSPAVSKNPQNQPPNYKSSVRRLSFLRSAGLLPLCLSNFQSWLSTGAFSYKSPRPDQPRPVHPRLDQPQSPSGSLPHLWHFGELLWWVLIPKYSISSTIGRRFPTQNHSRVYADHTDTSRTLM